MTTLLTATALALTTTPDADIPNASRGWKSILNALAAPEFHSLTRIEAPQATPEQIALAHDAALCGCLARRRCRNPAWSDADADTVMSPGSGEAALRAAGAVVAAVDAVIGGEASNAFCAVRPPGHHAEADRPMGFCLFNNVAIGAYHARERHGLRPRSPSSTSTCITATARSTCSSATRDCSTARPISGRSIPAPARASETGVGNICNVPLPPGAGSEPFRAAFERIVLPALAAVRAGAAADLGRLRCPCRDPLAGLVLEAEDFAWATAELMAVARPSPAAGASSRRSKAATTCRRWPPAPPPMSGR